MASRMQHRLSVMHLRIVSDKHNMLDMNRPEVDRYHKDPVQLLRRLAVTSKTPNCGSTSLGRSTQHSGWHLDSSMISKANTQHTPWHMAYRDLWFLQVDQWQVACLNGSRPTAQVLNLICQPPCRYPICTSVCLNLSVNSPEVRWPVWPLFPVQQGAGSTNSCRHRLASAQTRHGQTWWHWWSAPDCICSEGNKHVPHMMSNDAQAVKSLVATMNYMIARLEHQTGIDTWNGENRVLLLADWLLKQQLLFPPCYLLFIFVCLHAELSDPNNS